MKTIDSTQIPEVLTVLLDLSQDDNGDAHFQLTNIIRAAGHIKDKPIAQANFEFRFIDKRGELITLLQQRIELTTTIEYVDEDGNLAKKRIKKLEKVVVVRTSYAPSISDLLIYSLPERQLQTTIPLKTVRK